MSNIKNDSYVIKLLRNEFAVKQKVVQAVPHLSLYHSVFAIQKCVRFAHMCAIHLLVLTINDMPNNIQQR